MKVTSIQLNPYFAKSIMIAAVFTTIKKDVYIVYIYTFLYIF
jgi:hypothetical protein